MARSKSDISNSAIRIFLQEVGKFYDRERGYDPFTPTMKQKDQLLKYFQYRCCYCEIEITRKSISQDHLIPMNKANLGLHAWGNVVPCCGSCNNEKQQKPWQDFLISKAGKDEAENRIRILESFVLEMKYDPELDLHVYADNLYDDIGAVAMTLIDLRYRQAEDAIKKLIRSN